MPGRNITQECSGPIQILQLSPLDQLSIDLRVVRYVEYDDHYASMRHDVFSGLQHRCDRTCLTINDEQQYFTYFLRLRFQRDEVRMPITDLRIEEGNAHTTELGNGDIST